MSRRAANRVRGPTSALTEFLREQGINARAFSGYTRRLVQQGGDEEEEDDVEEQPEAGPSTAVPPAPPAQTEVVGEEDEAGPSTTNNNVNGYTSDNLDGPEESPAPRAAAGRKKKATTLEKEKEKAKAKAAAAKKRKLAHDEDDDDEYTLPSKGASSVKMPDIGAFENCAECGKRFTFTKYTREADPGPGWLCPACTKELGQDPFKNPTPRKRKAPEEKRKIVSFDEKEVIMSLAEMCIETIGQYIEDVEALGDIGLLNMDKISKILSKNRRLTNATAQLFYDASQENLTLYDCTNLDAPSLIVLANLNPNLVSLKLEFCGRIDSKVLNHWATHLHKLKRLELLAPFLVTNTTWVEFFETVGPRLEGFLIENSPRFDETCVQSLVTNCPLLTELRLRRVGQMSDDWLPHLQALTKLRLLDLSEPSLTNHPVSLTDEPVKELFSKIGATLEHLDLSGHELLTKDVLLHGIASNMPKLVRLHLVELPNLTDESVAYFFKGLKCPPLEQVDLSRNPDLGSEALEALLEHSGRAIRWLNINQFKDASTESLMRIAEQAKQLEWLDAGFCRGMDDFVLKALQEGCAELKEVKVYGCNHVTENCPKKRGVKILGVESHTY